MRTPMCAASTVTEAGAPLLLQMDRPLEVPLLVRSVEAMTWPVLSLTNSALTFFGPTSGTPIGRAPDSIVFWRIDTRACALMNGTTCRALRNQGRSVSVSLTSIIRDVHGSAVSTVG